MARGFTGKSVEKFMGNTNEALNRAATAHDKNPFGNMSSTLVPLPNIVKGSNRQAPFEASDAWSDNHPTNVGNSSNIVVDPSIGEPTINRVSSLDDRVGQELYNICNIVEDVCKTVYIVPETIPRILNMCSMFKNSLSQFRTLTEETNSCMRNFMNEAANIDMGNGGIIAMSERSAEQNIGRVRSAMQAQANTMERTADSYRTTAESLQQKAKDQRQKAERLKNNPLSNVIDIGGE